MTTTAEKYSASNSLVQPVTSDETQESTGPTFHNVLLNNKTFTIRTDRRSAFLGDKILGFGMHIFQNGNIQLQAGPKKNGNGKFINVSRGGQIIKTGPTVMERTGFKKSFLQEDYDDEIIAAEETNYGDVVQRTHGTLRIKATNIILEADDSFSIISGDSTTIDSTGSVTQITGKYTSTFDTKEEIGDRASIKVLQRIMKSNDPRSSDDIVISGHVNRRFGGDYRVEAGGISATYIQGNKALPGVPLVLNRSVGLHIGLTAPSAGFGGINIESTTGTVDIKAGVDMKLDAKALFNLSTVGLTNITSGGDINMSSVKGIGISSGSATLPTAAVGDVKIKASNEIDIDATTDVNIKAAANVNIVGTKIYLN